MDEVVGRAEARAGEAASAASLEDEPKLEFWPFSKCYVGDYNHRPSEELGDISGLASGIAAVGLMNPACGRVVVRDGVELLEIYAGQRRFVAYPLAFPDRDGWFVNVRRNMTRAQAIAASIAENKDREDPSPLADALAAAKMVAECKGNRAEAAELLGWRLHRLNVCMRLMACSERVRQALRTDPPLPTGIAELLAGTTEEVQDELLASYLARTPRPSLADFKVEINARSKLLASAIFPKDKCTSCQFNSARQRALFENQMDDGLCLNASCYDTLTEEELAQRAEKLKTDYQRVHILRPGESLMVVPLQADGQYAVGSEQRSSCLMCKDYGALVSGLANNLGAIKTDFCFDSACNADKRRAFAMSQLPEEATSGNEGDVDEKTTTGSASKSGPNKASASQTAGRKAQSDKVKSEALEQVSLRPQIAEFRDGLYQKVILKEVAASPELSLKLLLTLATANRLSAVNSSGAREVCQSSKVLPGNLNIAAGIDVLSTHVFSADAPNVGRMVAGLSLLSVESLQRNELAAVVKCLRFDWGKHFELDRSFLQILTKTELRAVCVDVGLDGELENFEALFKEKLSVIVDGLLASKSFNYVGAIPRVLKP